MANASRRQRLRQAQEAQRKRKRVRTLAIIGVVTGAVVAIAVMLWSTLGGTPAAAVRPPNATAAGDGIVVNPGKAPASAPVVGVHLDYRCSHCVQFEEKFGLTLNELATAGDIQLVNHTRVGLDGGDTAGLSHKAAVAAACSDVAGVYRTFHQSIFAAAFNGAYTDQLLRSELPQQTGVTGQALTDFQKCYDDKATLGFVRAADEAGAKAGIVSTPTLLVNGKNIDLATLPDDVTQLKQFLLDEAK